MENLISKLTLEDMKKKINELLKIKKNQGEKGVICVPVDVPAKEKPVPPKPKPSTPTPTPPSKPSQPEKPKEDQVEK